MIHNMHENSTLRKRNVRVIPLSDQEYDIYVDSKHVIDLTYKEKRDAAMFDHEI